MSYPPEYYQAWDDMIATGRYWGMTPIHRGVFENSWKRALEAAARIAEDGGTADEIRALAIYAREQS